MFFFFKYIFYTIDKKKKEKQSWSKESPGTYPDGIFQRLRLLTKTVELVHGVWQMTREAYERPLAGPKY